MVQTLYDNEILLQTFSDFVGHGGPFPFGFGPRPLLPPNFPLDSLRPHESFKLPLGKYII